MICAGRGRTIVHKCFRREMQRRRFDETTRRAPDVGVSDSISARIASDPIGIPHRESLPALRSAIDRGLNQFRHALGSLQ